MSLSFNGITPADIKYNGTDISKVIYNGVTVWEKLFSLIENGVLSNTVTAIKETYHTTQSNIGTVNDNYTVSQNSWSGANFGTTVSRISAIDGGAYTKLKFTCELTGTYGGDGGGYTQRYICLVPIGTDFPKYSRFGQTDILDYYTGKYFNLYRQTVSGEFEIDLPDTQGTYELFIGVGGYNSSQTTFKISNLSLE